MGRVEAQLKEYIRLHGAYDPDVLPSLTHDLFNAIPEHDTWQFPDLHAPLTIADNVRQFWDRQLCKWLDFFGEAEKGLESAEKAVNKHEFHGSFNSLQALRRFEWGGLGSTTHEKIQSVRKVFASLLSDDAREKLRIPAEAVQVTPDDIALARLFVKQYEDKDNLNWVSQKGKKKAKRRR